MLIQSEKSFAGPPKVENVNFGRNSIVSNMIRQVIEWGAVQVQNDETNYHIKYTYNTSAKMTTASPTTVWTTSIYTLMLKVPTSNITFTIWVAAIRSTAPDKSGDFSDPQSITYTSTFGDHF